MHHGNGTQEIFESDPSVLFIDIHQAEVWPGTGALEEMGAGSGAGYTINVPLPWSSGDGAARRVFESIVVPAARRFGPSFILVSSGFDSHIRDPLEKLQVCAWFPQLPTTAGTPTFGASHALGTLPPLPQWQSCTYHFLASQALALARELCNGRCMLLLEGGYCLEALAESAAEAARGLLGLPPATPLLPLDSLPQPEPTQAVEAVISNVAALHGLA